jgi:glycosyltransferase involved in cell wall biosynthesis
MSDSPTAPSGFGNVTRFVCAGLAAFGHQISILGWQTRGMPSTWQGMTIYPVRNDALGADVLLTYLQKLRPDLLVTLADVWWLTYLANPLIANFMRMAGIPWALYYPIDGDLGEERLPPSWVRVLQAVQLPIAMSQYGRDVTRANGISPAYIPHGIDTRVFHPPEDKDAAKDRLGYAGRFVILSDARNQPRKMIPRTLEIFARFAQDKPDALLHLHCDPRDPAARAPEYYYDLEADIALLGLQDKVRLTAGMSMDRGGLSLEDLAAIYHAADVHLLSSWGEGFGLPTLQAAACGVVPMGSDYTATRELTLGHGEPLRVSRFLTDQFGIRRALVDIQHAVERMEMLYRDHNLLLQKAAAAARFAQPYDWQNIIPQWHDLLESQLPHLRRGLQAPQAGAQITFGAPQVRPATWGFAPAELANAVMAALPNFAGGFSDGGNNGVSVSLNVVSAQAGQLTGEVYRDAFASGNALSLPAALPSPDAQLVKTRPVGSIYLASSHDVALVQRLGEVFPAIKAWSSQTLDLGIGQASGKAVRTNAISSLDPSFPARMAATSLVLDLGGTDPRLPAQAARFKVPCIAPASSGSQAWLWPELCPDEGDFPAALAMARRIFTDQGAAEECCSLATQRLNRLPIPGVQGDDR